MTNILEIKNSKAYSIEIKKKKDKGEKEKTQSEISEITKIISAVFGGLALAFSKTFWFQSTSVEVYSLHLLLITIIILMLVKAYIISFSSDEIKPWLILAVVLALGFTNHMTTLLILPGTAYLYFSRFKINKTSIKRVLVMILSFLPVLIIIYSSFIIACDVIPTPLVVFQKDTNLDC